MVWLLQFPTPPFATLGSRLNYFCGRTFERSILQSAISGFRVVHVQRFGVSMSTVGCCSARQPKESRPKRRLPAEYHVYACGFVSTSRVFAASAIPQASLEATKETPAIYPLLNPLSQAEHETLMEQGQLPRASNCQLITPLDPFSLPRF